MSKKSILIADSGATKTDWCLIKNDETIIRFISKGLSPIYQTEAELSTEINLNVLPGFKECNIDEIYFYGTGCIPEKIETMKNAIHKSFPIESIQVYSDLIAATHSLCGHNSGIACILGTGSNSCEWDGEKIVNQVSPLGFILGDEGSGASLGKMLVSDALKNQLSPGLKEKFLEQFNLSQSQIIENVYRKPFPSRFLASLSPFLLQHIDDSSIHSIIERGFNDFFIRNIMQYNFKKNSVNFVGSIAFHYEQILRNIANNHGIEIGKIIQSPMEGLIGYYN